MDSTLENPSALLASRLRAARDALSLSQVEAAERIGCSVRSLQDYEAGVAWPRPAMRRRLLAFITDLEKQAA